MKRTALTFVLLAAAVTMTPACKKSSNPSAPAPASPAPTSTPTPTPPPCYVNSMTCTPSATPTASLTFTTTRTRTLTATITPTLSPTSTATNLGGYTSTPSPTPNPCNPLGWWGGGITKTSLQTDILLWIDRNITDAQVKLTGSVVPLPVTVPYVGAYEAGGVTYAMYRILDGPWSYVPGAAYTLTASARGVTTSASVTAPGGITYDTYGGAWVDWLVDGEDVDIDVRDAAFNSTFWAGGDLDAPFSIPVTAYPSPGMYTLLVDITNGQSLPCTCGYCGSLHATEMLDVFIDRPLTPLPTYTPTRSRTPTPTWIWTPTPTPDATTMPCGGGISGWASMWRVSGCSVPCTLCSSDNSAALMTLSVDQQPVTDAAVTIIDLSAGTSYALLYDFNVIMTGPTGPSCLWEAAMYSVNGIAYVPGHTYRLVVDSTAGQASADLTAPGGISVGPGGDSASWSYDGTDDSIRIFDSACATDYQSTGDAATPFNLAPHYPNAGTYYVQVQCEDSAAMTGFPAGFLFTAMDHQNFTVNR